MLAKKTWGLEAPTNVILLWGVDFFCGASNAKKNGRDSTGVIAFAKIIVDKWCLQGRSGTFLKEGLKEGSTLKRIFHCGES